MIYVFKPHEENYKQWCAGDFEGVPDIGREFLRNLESPNFAPKLWKHQAEALKRSIYSLEILDWPDLLLNVVTGGGKTVVIAGMIAYLKMAHDIRQHLILVPNTTVRARLIDDFSPSEPEYTYRRWPFFCGRFANDWETLSFHLMKSGESPAGIRNANIILGNVHQIYERTDNWRVIYENCDRLAIYNDEAHNTKAEQYNDLINKLKPKRVLRLDTTATPDRLDGLHPDSKMIYVYGIQEAMHDKIVKRVVVFKPDIEKVKITYFDMETKKEITADEMPWEDIERKKIPAVRYVMNPKPMEQQLAIALECLKYQRKTVPIGQDGKPTYKPLLFVVALSINDAKNIKATIESLEINGEPLTVLLVTNESDEELREEAMHINRDIKNCKYDAIVSVLMLREGWDVKNISVILLFRKFSYQMVGDQVHSVYGPQIIGRGLRRINPNSDDWEQCQVVDHPILKHDWLWELIKAYHYQESLNPGDVIDEQKIPLPPRDDIIDDLLPKPLEKPIFDPNDFPPVPEPPEDITPLEDWMKFLDECQYDLSGMTIEQTIRQIKSRNLGSGYDTLENPDLFEVSMKDVNAVADPDAEGLRNRLVQLVRRLAYDSLMEYDRSPDIRQQILLPVIHDHLSKRFLLGANLHKCDNMQLLKSLYSVFDQVRHNFLDHTLIASILLNPPKES